MHVKVVSSLFHSTIDGFISSIRDPLYLNEVRLPGFVFLTNLNKVKKETKGNAVTLLGVRLGVQRFYL